MQQHFLVSLASILFSLFGTNVCLVFFCTKINNIRPSLVKQVCNCVQGSASVKGLLIEVTDYRMLPYDQSLLGRGTKHRQPNPNGLKKITLADLSVMFP